MGGAGTSTSALAFGGTPGFSSTYGKLVNRKYGMELTGLK